MYDVHRLRLLRELSHRGTLAAVAGALGYSPSSVSHQLTQLEREVGVPLLEPVGRGVRLTAAAHTLVTHTEKVLAELERAEAAIAASRGTPSGTVRIATFQTAAHELVPPALTLLEHQHPQLTVRFAHVLAQDAIPALMARDFDVVLFERYPGEPTPQTPAVRTQELGRDPIVLAIPAIWPPRSLPQLADAAWVMEHPGTGSRSWSTTHCRSAGFEPRVAYESSDVYLNRRLVEQDHAVTFLPQLILLDHPAGIRSTPTGVSRSLGLATRRGSNANPAITAVTTALAATATASLAA